jgi:hypothetical protein
VRSHAKASPVGSNSDRGASRRSLRRPGALAALLVALMAAACLLPGSALAVEQRSVVESFGLDGTSTTEFANPAQLAFDQGNKRLYVDEEGAKKIYGYDASTPATHTPLGGNFPLNAPGFGEFDDLAVDSSSHNIYFASAGENTLYGYDSSGATLAGFPIAGQVFSCGTAVDSAGNVWVAEAFEGAVRKYSPAGVLLGTISTGGPTTEPCDLAFDSNDNLYVGFWFGTTSKFTAASNYTASEPFDSELTNAVTVDPTTDEVYVAHEKYISAYETDGTLLYEFGKSVAAEHGKFNGVAVDPSTEQVYASSKGEKKVLVFGAPLRLPKPSTEGADGITATTATVHGTVNPEGQALTDCHFEVVLDSQYRASKFEAVSATQEFPCVPAAGSIPADSNPHAVSADADGLEAATAYRYRLVASNAIGTKAGSTGLFFSGAEAPLIEEQSIESVGTGEATLRAKINPRGGETTYRVEYGTTTAYGQSTAESAPFGFSEDTSGHLVSVHIGGLNSGTAYHFRFVATGPVGGDQGDDVSFATYPAVEASSGSCPNEQFRTGFGTRLPDCRAYEQATPVEKHGANIQGAPRLVEASGVGDRVTFLTLGGLATSGSNSNVYPYMASRGPGGWGYDGLLPSTEPGVESRLSGWSDDLSIVFGSKGSEVGTGSGRTLYVRESDTSAFHFGLFNPTESTITLNGFADDTSHFLFETEGPFLPEAPAGVNNLYEFDHGTVTLPARIPVGSTTSCDDEAGPACVLAPNGSYGGPYNWKDPNLNYFGGSQGRYYTQNTISSDGSKVFFTAVGTGQLYVREDGVRTTRISASQRTTPDPNGEKPAAFVGATPDGSKVFFLSCEKLTDDSTAVSTAENACTRAGFEAAQQGQDLYSYDTDSHELTDLTVDSNPGDSLGAGVDGVLGMSNDGTYFYIAARGVLAPGATPASCSGPCNVYVLHDGTTKLVTEIAHESERFNWAPRVTISNTDEHLSRVSADGKSLLFVSTQSLTGYNSVGTGCAGNPCQELFRYTAPDEKLLCVSCNPTGIPPRGNARFSTDGRASLLPALAFTFLTRNLSADGDRVFFDSRDALVPADTNGVNDVYEWEAKGSGSCRSEAQDGGCIYLLSGGDGSYPSYFGDASSNGDHVFIFSNQRLVPGDEDDLTDIYDAGVGAGLATQHPLAAATCTSSACQANPPPPPDQTAASAVFSGAGNARKPSSARKCAKGQRKVRKAGKVRCQKAHKQHKRHDNRGGAK